MVDSKGSGAEIQVRAQFLRDAEYSGETPATRVRMCRSWRAHDLRRALAAASKAGLEHYRVEIAPDGTIAIVVGFETGRARR